MYFVLININQYKQDTVLCSRFYSALEKKKKSHNISMPHVTKLNFVFY